MTQQKRHKTYLAIVCAVCAHACTRHHDGIILSKNPSVVVSALRSSTTPSHRRRDLQLLGCSIFLTGLSWRMSPSYFSMMSRPLCVNFNLCSVGLCFAAYDIMAKNGCSHASALESVWAVVEAVNLLDEFIIEYLTRLILKPSDKYHMC